jgi:hypothetical protein
VLRLASYHREFLVRYSRLARQQQNRSILTPCLCSSPWRRSWWPSDAAIPTWPGHAALPTPGWLAVPASSWWSAVPATCAWWWSSSWISWHASSGPGRLPTTWGPSSTRIWTSWSRSSRPGSPIDEAERIEKQNHVSTGHLKEASGSLKWRGFPGNVILSASAFW